MKAVCRTSSSNPLQSLIKHICYPESFILSSKQTSWGCTHEGSARKRYEIKMKESHSSFSVDNSGFIINPEWPFVGATPDGTVSCLCCGKGIVEIKCPFCHKGDTIEQAAEDKKFCPKKSNDKIFLDRAHAYYYQVQTQLFVADADYCDFCLCTKVKLKMTCILSVFLKTWNFGLIV